jgi:flagellar motor protein MotB
MNNSRFAGASRVAAATLPAESALAGLPQLSYTRQTSTAKPVYGYSTLFMAQVMAQPSANDNGLIESFFTAYSATQTVEPEMMEDFSLVRYLPSNAGKPESKPVAQAFTPPTPERPPVVIQQTENAAQQQRAEHSASTRPQAAASSATASVMRSAPSQGAPRMENKTAEKTGEGRQIRLNGSLIRAEGTDAYRATFSRNLLRADSQMVEAIQLTV